MKAINELKAKRRKEAEMLARNCWIGTPEQLKERIEYYVETGRFWSIIHHL